MCITGLLVVVVVIIQVIHSQSLSNPINNLAARGQSGNEQPPTTYPPTQSPDRQQPQSSVKPGSISQLIRQAVEKVNDEVNTMKRRVDMDIDRHAPNFDIPGPLLIRENATAISTHSRIINWIVRLRRRYNMLDEMSPSENHEYDEKCPFVFRTNYTSSLNSRYRTIDGFGNNLNWPNCMGEAFIPFYRLIRYSEYDYLSYRDGDDEPRVTSRNGGTLPNARVVSTRFHETSLSSGKSEDSPFTMLLPVFGQFIAHDVADIALTKGYRQSVLKCCNQRIPTPVGVCDNIAIPRRDAFRQTKNDCLEFIRSLEVTDCSCSGTKQQLNQATSFIDGSNIYGATQKKSDSLREFKGGLLMTSLPNKLPIPPPGNAHPTVKGFASYPAGDNRVNKFIGLIGLETLWVREHNRIAKNLYLLNLNWDDETIFQEARRIIIALIQHITYAEYLPALLGPKLIDGFWLHDDEHIRFNYYHSRLNPGVSNVFATVAMGYVHSMLRTPYNLLDRSYQRNGDTPIDLKDTSYRPKTFIVNDNPLMRGMASDPSKICGRMCSGSAMNLNMTNPGTDLVASIVQRSRDHGIPSYATFRRYWNLPVPEKFDNSLTGFPDHSNDDINKLKAIYSHPEDVEVFSAGISEKPVANGAVGPLFGKIIAEQFVRLRRGDRFWYEYEEEPRAFTDEQLKEIKKVTFARILCNGNSFETIQKRVFSIPTPWNRRFPCRDIPSLNLTYWTAPWGQFEMCSKMKHKNLAICP